MSPLLHRFIACLCLIFLAACTQSNSESTPVFQRNNILASLTETVIHPQLSTFVSACNDLKAEGSLFYDSPSVSSLSRLQQAFLTAQSEWHRLEGMTFGPTKTLKYDQYINYWPKKTDYIEQILSDTTPISSTYIVTTSQRGLPVIESLLFDPNQTPEALIQTLIQTRTRDYLLFLLTNLSDYAQQTQSQWVDGYDETFSSTGVSFSILTNHLVHQLERILIYKLGVPMGNKSHGQIRPSLIESVDAQQSLSNMAHNLESIRAMMTGDHLDKQGQGLNDYLIYLGYSQLSQRIVTQIDNTVILIESMTRPLSTMLVSEFEQLEHLYSELQTLLRYLKVDMASAINVTIYFNDSDGD